MIWIGEEFVIPNKRYLVLVRCSGCGGISGKTYNFIFPFSYKFILTFTETCIFYRIKTSKERKLLKENDYYNPISEGDYSVTDRWMKGCSEKDKD